MLEDISFYMVAKKDFNGKKTIIKFNRSFYDILQLSLKSTPISYVLVVLEAEEFVDMINKHALDKHIKSLQDIYPGFTLCYLINKLMRYLHKRFEN